MKPRRQQSGFTLVETIVVVAIIGIVVLPILSLFSAGLSNIRDSRLLLIASYVAQEKVEEVLAALPSQRASMSGAGQGSDTRFAYTRTVSDYGGGLLRVTVLVTWQEPRGERSYKVVTLVAAN